MKRIEPKFKIWDCVFTIQNGRGVKMSINEIQMLSKEVWLEIETEYFYRNRWGEYWKSEDECVKEQESLIQLFI